ncbi:MAG: OsmC family protein [Anaerolineales bacterium]
MKDTAVSVSWTGKRQFIGTDSGKHSVVISSHDEDNHTGVKPSELLLLAIGACSAYDVVAILEKKRYELRSVEVRVQASQEAEPPHTFRKIHLIYEVAAEGLKQKDAEQAASLSLEKYCSVAATVSSEAEITYEVVVK